MPNLIVRITAYGLILLLSLLQVNKSVFYHAHKLSDGRIIQHAHPFSRTNDSEPIKKHHHSQMEFLLFGQAGFLFFVGVAVFLLTVLLLQAGVISFQSDFTIFSVFTIRKGRSPPASPLL